MTLSTLPNTTASSVTMLPLAAERVTLLSWPPRIPWLPLPLPIVRLPEVTETFTLPSTASIVWIVRLPV